jgi:hypothetical protein
MKFKTKFNSLIKMMGQVLPEIMIILGLFFIIYITFSRSFVGGMYLTGFILFITGIILAVQRG